MFCLLTEQKDVTVDMTLCYKEATLQFRITAATTAIKIWDKRYIFQVSELSHHANVNDDDDDGDNDN